VSFRFLSSVIILSVFASSCKKQTENIVVRYEITSSITNKFKVSYFSDLDAEKGTRSVITVDGGYWTANHIGQKFEPYYIEVTHDTASKPPYKFELFIIANEDTVEHHTDTLRFEKVIFKGRKS
jgi:hypothetical protein